MDVYLEYMIKKKKTPVEHIITLGYYLLAFAVSYVLLFVKYITMFYPALVVGAFWLAWYMSRKFNVEYEYILTNDELDVDRIIAKRIRKRLLTVSVRKFEIMEPAVGEAFEKAMADSSIQVKFDASLGANSENRYYAKFINKKGEKMILVFNPTDNMLRAMKQSNMRNIRLEEGK